jgi:hypothetical protein
MFFVSLRHGQVEGETDRSPAYCSDLNAEFYLRICSQLFDTAGDPVIISSAVFKQSQLAILC